MRKIAAILVVFSLLAYVVVREYFPSQVALPQMPLIIETAKGPVRFTVELATTGPQQEQGLMHRKSLAPNAGMLFDFHAERHVAFWMKDTLIPLDMVFIRANGIITAIAANAKPMSLDTVGPRGPVQAVLEIPGGRAAELNVKPGDRAVSAIFKNAPP
jgi:uncharacterized membrane protein (UPF0127 family)